MNKITISDVAKRARTAPSTVSRVLNNSASVSPETRENVLKAIRDLGYVPNNNARALKSGKSRVIGLVVSQQQIGQVIMNPAYPMMIKIISEKAQSEGYNILLITSAGVDYNSYDELIMNHAVDGFIVAGAMIDDTLHLTLDKMNIPYVYDMKFSPNQENCYVTFDNQEGGYIAAKYLLDLGHREIKLIVGEVKGTVLTFNLDRIAGFKRALNEYQVPFQENMVIRVPGDMDISYNFINNLYSKEIPSALLLSNEVTSIAALTALLDKGFKVPEDVSIVGFGHPDVFRYTRPTLTTVGQDIVWQGNHLVDMLLQRINDPQNIPMALTKKPELVVRDSVRKF